MGLELLEDLNEKQREAVTAALGHCLILAGAGSGKTRVLVSRIAWLISQCNISPYEILAVTFTNKAAAEMRSRLSQTLHIPLQEMWVGTFHGLCHRILRRHYQEAQLPAEFHILDSEDQARVIKRVLVALNLDSEQWPIKSIQTFINSHKDEGKRPQHIHPAYDKIRTLITIYTAYEEACQAAGVLDFAELLLRAHELLRNNPGLATHYQQRFKEILVDEFQDTNAIQYAFIRLLKGELTHVMGVGDDDQSIYGWRGAKVENIQRFSEDFNPVKMIRLEQNYRSTSTILNAANALIAHNSMRLGKNLWTAGGAGEKIDVYNAFSELDEARFIAERIRIAMQEGYNLKEIAILYRSNAQSRVIEEALLRASIPYRIYGGMRFFERAEIKDTLAYLRLIANPRDDTAYERVINFPTRGIGEKTLSDIRTKAKEYRCSLWETTKNLIEAHHFTAKAQTALHQFIELITQLQIDAETLALDGIVTLTLNKFGLLSHFGKIKGEKSESKLDNLQELVNAAKQFQDESQENDLSPLTAFLAHASLEAGERQEDQHERHVQLMTLHAAKGLEFSWVFLAGLEEGLFPSQQTFSEEGRLEEERRLCYVGLTRARKKLTISYAEVRRQYGREEYHRASRFLKEIPAEFLNHIRVAKAFTPAITQHESGMKLGQSVTHSKFGQGVILALEGSGAHTRVQIKFAAFDTKWLVLAYANLTLLQEPV